MSTYQKIWNQAKRRTGQTNLTDAVGLEYLDFALDNYSNIVMTSDGRWKFDDINNTTHPKGYVAAVSGQNDYELDVTFLQVDQVHFKTSAGAWTVLEPVDSKDYQDMPLDQVYKTAGTPKVFDYDGTSIWLYPAPNFSDSGDLTDTANLSIRVRHTRPAIYVTALSDSLGIPRTHTGYILADVCYQIATSTNDDSMVMFEREMARQADVVKNTMSVRDEASHRQLRPRASNVFSRFKR